MASRITVLVSGRGSNLAALLGAQARDALGGGRIVRVVANRPQAGGLGIAAGSGVPTRVVDHHDFAQRDDFDVALADAVAADAPDLVVLAGFMRVLGPGFIERFAGRMLNIHPSLLPAFPGLHTHRRALAEGVRVHGCTVHFVTADVDVGPIVAQAAVPVHDDDDETSLAARVLAAEHVLLPHAVAWYCLGRLAIVGKRVHLTGDRLPRDAALFCPDA
ncbi:MAG: phosphoribosylglycinamide formyltransferase [Burkholderiales bacterium]|nr:phosphoribosylglycinamide formyltransferase [Burkholderiales bacterium]